MNSKSTNRFLYCGEYFDVASQTYYLRARSYDPSNGRFTQQDDWSYADPNDPLSLNLYTYCKNDPVNYIDPSGDFFISSVWVFAISGAIIGAIIGGIGGSHLAKARNIPSEDRWEYVLRGAFIGSVLGFIGGAGIGNIAYHGFGAYGLYASASSGVHWATTKSVWALEATERGMFLEKMYHGMCNNIRVFDKFTGIPGNMTSITSIKTLNLLNKTYQSAYRLYYKLITFGKALFNFSSTEYRRELYRLAEDGKKILELIMPDCATPEQLDAINKAVKEISENGIDVIIHYLRY